MGKRRGKTRRGSIPFLRSTSLLPSTSFIYISPKGIPNLLHRPFHPSIQILSSISVSSDFDFPDRGGGGLEQAWASHVHDRDTSTARRSRTTKGKEEKEGQGSQERKEREREGLFEEPGVSLAIPSRLTWTSVAGESSMCPKWGDTADEGEVVDRAQLVTQFNRVIAPMSSVY